MPQPLEYRTPVQPHPEDKKYKMGPAPTDPESRHWRSMRRLFYIALIAVFAPFALYFGPNYILFGKWTPLAPEDFVSLTQIYGVSIERAVKQFHEDNNRWPANEDELIPNYLPARPVRAAVLDHGTVELWGEWHHLVEYDPTKTPEQWVVRGPSANGPLGLPPVTVPTKLHP